MKMNAIIICISIIMGNHLEDFVTAEQPSDGTQDNNPAANDVGSSGGSLVFFTQGDVVFATMTSFLIVVVALFVMYQRKRRREDSYVDDDDPLEDFTTDCNSLIEDKRFMKDDKGGQPNLFSSHAIVDAENARGGRSWRENRRGSLDSASTYGSGIYGRRSSMGSNVSNQYKLAAIDRMRQLSSSSVSV